MADTLIAQSLALWKKRAFLVWTLIGAAVLVMVICTIAGILAMPIAMLVWALIFVFCLHPVVSFFEKKGVPRVWGTLLAFILMFLVLGAAILVMFSPVFGISEQFASLAEELPGYLSAVYSWSMGLYDQYSELLKSATVRKWLESGLTDAAKILGDLGTSTAAGIVGFGAAAAGSVMSIGFALVIAFWLLMDLPKMGCEIRRLIPERLHEDWEMISLTLTTVIGGYIKGTLIQCFLIGAASGVAYAAVGLPSPVALAIITGLLNIIPVVGPWLGGALAAFVGIMVNPMAALAAFVASVIIQQVVYTFISPKLMADSVDIHPALMILALMCGSAIGSVAGGIGGTIVGMLAAIPLVAAAKALFVYYYEKSTRRRLVDPDGVFFKGDVDSDPDHDPNPLNDAVANRPRPASGSGFGTGSGSGEGGARKLKEMTGSILPLDQLKGQQGNESDKPE